MVLEVLEVILKVLEVVLKVLEVFLEVFAQGFSLKVPKAKGGGCMVLGTSNDNPQVIIVSSSSSSLPPLREKERKSQITKEGRKQTMQ